ncbi:hypothetical protein [Pseudomonas sichuanensis]|uniref:hypothetical protein n=1 Tax=Pseudomonas sichuanensis TaxID=2213015 RepID=UPI002ABB546D|nr:hypothetical protein [Pseudomonas sichuanensis]MDZ4021001.1 hypothetical protein [Pseudomonas sichuanensis]
MSANKNVFGESVSPDDGLTSQGLRDLVLNHVLNDLKLFIPDGTPHAAQRMVEIMASLEALTETVAITAMANRTHLSALKTCDAIIHGDPELKVDDPAKYELRYRAIEQQGDNEPSYDRLYSLDEVMEEYGQEFVETFWGKFGENCPNNLILANGTQLWFTVVRYPVASQSAQLDNVEQAYVAPSRRAGMGNA